MSFIDWEAKSAYLLKKYFETSLDQLCENTTTGGILNIPALIADDPDTQDEILSRKRAEDRINKIYELLSKPGFFTDRQVQVLSLSLGWINGKYVGCKNVSEISRILKLSQPVVFNHYKLIVKKLKKYFDANKNYD